MNRSQLEKVLLLSLLALAIITRTDLLSPTIIIFLATIVILTWTYAFVPGKDRLQLIPIGIIIALLVTPHIWPVTQIFPFGIRLVLYLITLTAVYTLITVMIHQYSRRRH